MEFVNNMFIGMFDLLQGWEVTYWFFGVILIKTILHWLYTGFGVTHV